MTTNAPNVAQLVAPTLPFSRRDNVTETLHGLEVSDPYRWLEDQDSPETREWIDAQMPTRTICLMHGWDEETSRSG